MNCAPRTVADYLKYNRRSGAGGGDDAQHAYVRMVRGGQDDMHEKGSRSKVDTSYTLITYVPIQRSAKVDAPGCVNAAGKLGQKW